jgi:UDP-glucuronate decarboxylase
VQELAHLIRNLTGSSSQFVYRPLPADDRRQRRPDITRAQSFYRGSPYYPWNSDCAAPSITFAANLASSSRPTPAHRSILVPEQR